MKHLLRIGTVMKPGLLIAFFLQIPGVVVLAQTGGDRHLRYEKYWKDDIAFLEKIKNEKDGHLAAQLLSARKDQMLPRLQELVKETSEYKRTASAADQRKEEEWVMGNPLQEKDADLDSDLTIYGSTKGAEFSKAVAEYRRASMSAIRKAKQ